MKGLLAVLWLISNIAWASCSPSFPFAQGWLGGDAGYSVSLANGKRLWFFGDSFVSNNPKATARAGSYIVHNSVALSSCRNGKWSINYYWRHQQKQAIFAASKDNYFWPRAAWLAKGHLLLSLGWVRNAKQQGSWFDIQGSVIAEIDNPMANPLQWHIHYHKIDLPPSWIFASSSVQSGDYRYFYICQSSKSKQPLILGRAKSGDMHKLTLLTATGWQRYHSGIKPKQIVPNAATELSVQHHKQWQMVYSLVGQGIYRRTAPKPTGPWSKPQKLLDYAGAFCYAAKQLPATDDGVMDICSTPGFFDLAKDMNLYRWRIHDVSIDQKRL